MIPAGERTDLLSVDIHTMMLCLAFLPQRTIGGVKRVTTPAGSYPDCVSTSSTVHTMAVSVHHSVACKDCLASILIQYSHLLTGKDLPRQVAAFSGQEKVDATPAF